MRAVSLALLLALTLAAPVRAAPPVTPDEVTGPETWGDLQGVTHLGSLSFSGQPDPAALRAARENGVVAVINLRAPSEQADLGFDERAEVAGLGMTYHQIPVTRPDFYADPTVAAIEAAVAAQGGGSVLVHCSSGSRAAGWLALHLVRERGMSLDDALAVARRAGVTKPAIEDAVRRAEARRSAD